MCEQAMPAWAMVTFGLVVFGLGLEAGIAMGRLSELWRKQRNGR